LPQADLLDWWKAAVYVKQQRFLSGSH